MADPTVGPDDLLVRVEAFSVNPVDVKQRQGTAGRLAEPRVLGWDSYGTVLTARKDDPDFKPGDKVYFAGDITRPGSYGALHAVDARTVAHAPKSLSPTQAAALPLTTLAAHEALLDRLEINRAPEPGMAVLIIGGAGGLGSMAIQLARQLSRCTVIATASRPQSREWCEQMGAHHVIDHSADIKAQLAELGFADVPYILNCSDNLPYWQLMSELVAPEGAICLMSSTKAPLDLDIFMAKSVRINWELMFTRPMLKTCRGRPCAWWPRWWTRAS